MWIKLHWRSSDGLMLDELWGNDEDKGRPPHIMRRAAMKTPRSICLPLQSPPTETVSIQAREYELDRIFYSYSPGLGEMANYVYREK